MVGISLETPIFLSDPEWSRTGREVLGGLGHPLGSPGGHEKAPEKSQGRHSNNPRFSVATLVIPQSEGSRPALPVLHDVLCCSRSSGSYGLRVAVVEPSAKTLGISPI